MTAHALSTVPLTARRADSTVGTAMPGDPTDIAVVVWLDDVRIMGASGEFLRCIWHGREFMISPPMIHPLSPAQKVGDVGRLGVPRWFAEFHSLTV